MAAPISQHLRTFGLAAVASFVLIPSAFADIAPSPLPRPIRSEEDEAATFASFRTAFTRAVAKKDVNAVVKLCSFPLHSYEMGSVIAKAERKKDALSPEITEAAFRKHFSKLFPAEVMANLRGARPLRHTVDDDPHATWYSVGHSSGKTWSAWFIFAGGADPRGQWSLRGTDNVSE